MTEKALDGLRVAILATNGVQETELAEPRKALENAGARTNDAHRAQSRDDPGQQTSRKDKNISRGCDLR